MNMRCHATGAVVVNANGLEEAPAGQRRADAPAETVEAVHQLIEDAHIALYSDSETAIVRLVQAIDLLYHVSKTSSARTRLGGGLAGWQIKRVDSFIDLHLDSTIRTPQLAAILNLSVSHFSHAFKQTMGVAPLVYVARRRIELARQAMLESRMSLTDIALSHGFCDQSHFSRTFRRETGLTPQMWRRMFGQPESTEGRGIAD